MSRFSLAPLCLALLALPAPAAAATASLVADIDPHPALEGGVVHDSLLSLGDRVFFPGYELGSGVEPWVSDGTSFGTDLLRDLCPGECWSDPRPLGVLPGRIAVFQTRDDPYTLGRAELWRTDGTKAGTFRIAASAGGGPDVCFGGTESLVVGGTLFFTGTTPSSGCELWTTDGTAAGTRKVKELGPDSSGGLLSNFASVAGTFYFAGFSPQGTGLWRSDGTEAGTVRLATLPVESPSNLSLPSTVVGSRLFFLVPEIGELWVSDGTAAGTRPVVRFNAQDAFLSGSFLKAIDGIVYFVASDGSSGSEIWRSDGTAAGTKRITAFPYAQPFELYSLDSSRFVKAGNRLVFVANDSGQGFRLWTSGGTLETTALLSGCAGGVCPAPGVSPLVPVGNRIVFSGRTESRGTELWVSDGTGAGTRLVSDLCRGRCSSEPSRIVPLLGKAFFLAGIPQGLGLFRTDGTSQGTVLLADLGPNPFEFSELFEIVAAGGGKIFFRARAHGAQRQLWTSDGTPGGTAPVTLLGSLGSGSDPFSVRAFGNDALFVACDGEDRSLWRSDGTAGGTLPLPATGTDCTDPRSPRGLTTVSGIAFFQREQDGRGQIWRTDGTDAGTYPLPPFGAANAGLPVAAGSRVVFPVFIEDLEISLWESDGTIPGTRKLFDLPANVFSLSNLTVAGSRLYFVANGGDTTADDELWVSDGTLAGTRQLTHTEGYGFDERFELTAVGDTVFFIASDSPYLYLLWKTDGTPEGTRPVLPRSFEPRGRDVKDLVAFQGALYFMAAVEDGRRGLWRSDGTEAGTVPVRALGPGSVDGPEPVRFTEAGDRLFFVADDGEHGVELWTTDGTPEGTVLVRDIAPGAVSSHPAWLVAAGGRLFFSATDGEHGVELWESDGTAAGTRMIQDLAPGELSSHPGNLTAAGDRLFFAADDGVHGREPWILPLTGAACQPSDTVLCLKGGRFKVEASWRDFEGRSGPGHAVALTADTGYFWFFDPANVEVISKVLDGQGVNGHHWVFYGALSTVQYTLTVTDTETGAARRYVNPPGRLGSVGDTNAFGPLGATGSGLTVGPEAVVFEPIVVAEKAAGDKAPCVPSATRLCLQGGRFAVTARWKDFDGNVGEGKAVPLAGGDTGYFWFFDDDNVEVVLKVLDGRPVNGKFWVFYGALSSVEYTLTVTDTETGAVKTYRNPAGRLGSVADTGAF